MNDSQIDILSFDEYDTMLKNNYNISQLKCLAKKYNLKINGNKNVLIARLFSYLFLSSKMVKIQRLCRKYIIKKYISSHGPAYFNRKLCINAHDFLTMDNVEDIPFEHFFSYRDDTNFVYGFDALSLHNLIQQQKNAFVVQNPFTNIPMSVSVIKQFNQMKHLSKILNIHINLTIDNQTSIASVKNSIQQTFELFQYINDFGHYANENWFINLSSDQLCDYVLELYEIWNYRAKLNNSIKKKICNPSGNPFLNENMQPNQTIISYLIDLPNIEEVRLSVLIILNNFVKLGINDEYKNIGCYYVLGALTAISVDAAIAMPWLHNSFG